MIEPETGATITQYDAAGNVAWTASGSDLPDASDCNQNVAYSSGRRVDRMYDARNRVKSLAFPDGRGNLEYTYGADGEVAALMAHNDGVGQNVVTTTYDHYRRGQLKNEEMSFGTTIRWDIDYAYSRNAHLAQQTYHGLAVDYAPNALGQATKAGTFASNVTYHPGGAIKQFTYGNGIVHAMTQNLRGLPDRSLDSYPGLPDALDDSYTYDGNGNVVAISDGATTGQRGNRTMIYDGLDRLTRVDSPMFAISGTGAATYSYDGVDNLKRVTIGATTIAPARDHCYSYDASQRLTNVIAGDCDAGSTVMGLAYDAQGNLSNRDGKNFDFDYGNRLRRVYPNTGPTTAAYLYDGHGRRIRDYTTASKYSQYTADGQLLQASDLRAGVSYEYVYLAGSLVAVRERTGTSGSYVYAAKYQHTDALGSPVAVTDAARVVVERTEYEPFGKVLKPTTPVDGPGYTGHVFDAHTGLNYAQQRYFDSTVGRFVSVDPVTADSNSGENFNRYWYADNSPYKFTDPDGRESSCWSTGVGCGQQPTAPVTLQDVKDGINWLAETINPLMAGAECVRDGCGAGGWAMAVVSAADPLPGPEDVARKEGAGYFVRFGKEAESAGKLGADAAKAEKAGLPHGVSVRARDRVSKADKANHRVASGADARGEFNVTQTGSDKRHHTVELPKPVTDDVADRFNEIFK